MTGTQLELKPELERQVVVERGEGTGRCNFLHAVLCQIII
jgi:hypothetical protein